MKGAGSPSLIIGRLRLFAGADADAMTTIESAKLSGHDPKTYLTDILARLHDHNIN